MIQWKLKPFLEQHQISAYALAKRLGGRLSSNTVYSLVRESPKRVDVDSLAAVIEALRDMTERDIEVGHLLEYRSETAPPSP
jgi:hypothetical protein